MAINVLVTDDSVIARSVIIKTLEAIGIDLGEIHQASDGRQAIEIIENNCVDLLLLDLTMPLMSGLDVLRTLKADSSWQNIPVILVTAMDDDEDVIRGLDAGAHDYITKPFKNEILAARVRSAVRIKQNHDKLQRLTEELRVEIAERKHMQQELVQAQRLESIGHLAAGIAHEINTPSQYIKINARFIQGLFAEVDKLLGNLVELLEAAKNRNIAEELIKEVDRNLREADVEYIRQEVPEAIQHSLDGIDRVAGIVQALKEFAHPETGQRQSIDINRTIESVLAISRNEWTRVAELVTDFDPRIPPISCLPGDINQAILNLVVNAAEAIAGVVGDGSHNKGTLTVRTAHQGDAVEIHIGDTGAGIPAGIRDKIFDQFFTTKDVGKGTGLGLSIAYSVIAQKHKGTITFETEDSKGSTFVVRLPLSDTPDMTPLDVDEQVEIELPTQMH
jgi:signal transduction histidine kinase